MAASSYVVKHLTRSHEGHLHPSELLERRTTISALPAAPPSHYSPQGPSSPPHQAPLFTHPPPPTWCRCLSRSTRLPMTRLSDRSSQLRRLPLSRNPLASQHPAASSACIPAPHPTTDSHNTPRRHDGAPDDDALPRTTRTCCSPHAAQTAST